jgi:glycosyltransferase involved in cell wall biosynthesis
MHVALLANRAWLDEELTPFRHLLVGLIDEQVRVAQVVPESIPADDLSGFGDHVPWREGPLPWLNTRRIARLAEPLGALGVDLIHALDGRMWRGGLALARELQVPAILSACSRLDIPVAQRLSGRLDPTKVALTATTEPLAGALREQLGPDFLVNTLPTGVHQQSPKPTDLDERSELCAIVSGNGVWDKNYDALLGGIASFVQHHPMSQFFFDGQNASQHQIWKAASSMGLLANISLTPRRLGHREMLLRAHVLIHPQALGKSRSLTLRAFARGLAVVARRDEVLDYLIDGQTAVVLDDPTPADWAQQFEILTEQPRKCAELGRSAAAWVASNRPTSKQVAGVLDIYRRMAGQTIPFPQ